MRNENKAFTITELIIVIVIVSIISAFAIPQYRKLMQKSEEREIYLQLISVRAAVQIYLAKTGAAQISDWNTVNEINAALNLNLDGTGYTYSCLGTQGGILNHCRIESSKYGWGLHFHGGNPIDCDTATPCPTCPDEAGGGCG